MTTLFVGIVFGATLLTGSSQATPSAKTEAFAALDAGRVDVALDAFERLVGRGPDDPDLYYGLGRSREALGNVEAAASAYRDALLHSPYHRRARFRLGNILLRMGDTVEAERVLAGYEPFRLWDHRVELLRAMVVGGTLTPADQRQKTLALVRLLVDGNALSEANEILTGVGADYAAEASFMVVRGRLLMASGALDEARVLTGDALDQAPNDPDAVWLNAKLDFRQGRPVEALHTYERLLTLWPDAPARVRHEIGTAFAVNQRISEAIPHFAAAVEMDPGLARAQADLALALAQTGNHVSAETHYREALELHPGLVAAQQGLASLLLERGDASQAIDLFRQSVALLPNDPIVHRNLGFALKRAGLDEEAEIELSTARALEARAKR